MSDKQNWLLTDEKIGEAFDNTFEKPVTLDHQPTVDEIFALKLRSVAQAQLDYAKPLVENQRDIIWIKALTRGGIAVSNPDQLKGISGEIRKDERERIQREYEGEWYPVTDTYCPDWILKFRQALKEGEKWQNLKNCC